MSALDSLRASLKLGALSTVMIGSLAPASACLIPDYCIRVGVAGRSMCKTFWNATGVDADNQPVVPIVDEDFHLIRGCICLSQESANILKVGDTDSLDYQQLELQLDTVVRSVCLDVATQQGLIEHNCLTADTINDEPTDEGPGECLDGCAYVNPPPWGSCPPDDQCSLDDDGDETAGTGTTHDTGQTEDSGIPPRLDLSSGSIAE